MKDVCAENNRFRQILTAAAVLAELVLEEETDQDDLRDLARELKARIDVEVTPCRG